MKKLKHKGWTRDNDLSDRWFKYLEVGEGLKVMWSTKDPDQEEPQTVAWKYYPANGAVYGNFTEDIKSIKEPSKWALANKRKVDKNIEEILASGKTVF